MFNPLSITRRLFLKIASCAAVPAPTRQVVRAVEETVRTNSNRLRSIGSELLNPLIPQSRRQFLGTIGKAFKKYAVPALNEVAVA